MRVASLICLAVILTLFFGMALDLIARGGASLTPTYLFEGVSDADRRPKITEISTGFGPYGRWYGSWTTIGRRERTERSGEEC